VTKHKAKRKEYFRVGDIQESQVPILWNCGGYKRQGCYPQGLSVVRNCKAVAQGLENFKEYLRSLPMNQAIIWHEGLSGRKWLREPNV
jgi:hypothetical protein